jgi:hypothetical protein
MLLTILGAVGSVVSILAAIWSLTNANGARHARNELMRRVRAEFYLELRGRGRAALESLKAIGPARTKVPAGTNVEIILESVQQFATGLRENEVGLFREGFSSLPELLRTLQRNMTAIRLNARDPKTLLSSGPELHAVVEACLGHLNSVASKMLFGSNGVPPSAP